MPTLSKDEQSKVLAALDTVKKFITSDGAGQIEILGPDFSQDRPRIKIIPAHELTMGGRRELEDDSGTIVLETIGWLEIGLWIGEKLAGGVVGEIGAKIWNRVTGERTLDSLYSDSVAAMRTIVTQAILESELNTAISKMKTAAEQLALYQGAPDHRLDTLANSEAFALESLNVFRSDRHRVAGLGSFLIGGGLVLALFQERLVRFRDAGEVNNIRSTVGTYTQEYHATYVQCIDDIKRQFSPGHIISQRPQDAPQYFFWAWQYRGRPFSGPQNTNSSVAKQEGIAAREAHISSEVGRFHTEIIHPADGIIRNWNTMAENAAVPS